MPGRVTARMPGPHVTHDARPQIQGITLAHDRSPDHGESSSAAPVTPSRFHLQARRSKDPRRAAQEVENGQGGRGASGFSLEQWSRACWPANRKPPDIVWMRQCLTLAWWYPMKAGPGSDRMLPDEPGVSRCGGRRRIPGPLGHRDSFGELPDRCRRDLTKDPAVALLTLDPGRPQQERDPDLCLGDCPECELEGQVERRIGDDPVRRPRRLGLVGPLSDVALA